jgi:hypothetical protein
MDLIRSTDSAFFKSLNIPDPWSGTTRSIYAIGAHFFSDLRQDSSQECQAGRRQATGSIFGLQPFPVKCRA